MIIIFEPIKKIVIAGNCLSYASLMYNCGIMFIIIAITFKENREPRLKLLNIKNQAYL